MKRRSFLTAMGGAVAAGMAGRLVAEWEEGGWRASTWIGRAPSYDADLGPTVRAGLIEADFGPARVRGRRVLLKPNLVEPKWDEPQINTNPKLVRAVAEVFRSFGAREVFVAEGPAHSRDTWLVLEQSGMEGMLREAKLEFVDLNADDLVFRENRLRMTGLQRLALPASLRRADLIVSMPKMKTHHWAGVTLSLKNLFGTMPGAYYGWPKNVLHHAGISGSILDINAAVRPHLAIVDGIVGMEGDGPIMGTAKPCGAIVIGANPTAVDATCARLMKIEPSRIEHLVGASGRLGPIAERHIQQRGEPIAALARPFAVPAHFQSIRSDQPA